MAHVEKVGEFAGPVVEWEETTPQVKIEELWRTSAPRTLKEVGEVTFSVKWNPGGSGIPAEKLRHVKSEIISGPHYVYRMGVIQLPYYEVCHHFEILP